jgi:acyl-CoA synthetase (AMP-forming)/AMP-acid ligase II
MMRDEYPSLAHLLLARGETPSEAAFTVVEGGEKPVDAITAGEIAERAKSVAACLQARTPAGTRVLLVLPHSIEFIVAFFGSILAGVVPVPTVVPQTRRSIGALLGIAASAEPSVALTLRRFLPAITEIMSDSTWGRVECRAIEDLLEEASGKFEMPDLKPDDLAYLQFTSGSTGRPKGVEVKHGNVLHNCRLLQDALEMRAGERIVSWLPFFHDWGLVGCMIYPLFAQLPTYLLNPLEFLYAPVRWLRAISRFRAVLSCAPNFAYQFCCEVIREEEKPNLDLTCWQVAMVGAEPVRKSTLERFASSFSVCGFSRDAFYPAYGLAENTLIVSGGSRSSGPLYLSADRSSLDRRVLMRVDREDARGVRDLVSCGHALGNQRVEIVNPATSIPCGTEGVGEIWVSGQSVTGGYWRHREATPQTYFAQLRNGDPAFFLRTGDLGFISGNELFVCGRLKDMIIKGGTNYFAEDVERVAEEGHTALRSCGGAAFGVDVADSERLVIVHELNYGDKPDHNEVFAGIQDAMLDSFGMMADAIVLIQPGSLPKTTSRKICREMTRALFLNQELQTVGMWKRW